MFCPSPPSKPAKSSSSLLAFPFMLSTPLPPQTIPIPKNHQENPQKTRRKPAENPQKHPKIPPPTQTPSFHCLLLLPAGRFYVQCADVKISSSAGPTKPSPVVAISGIEHLPAEASAYRNVYNGQGPEEAVG